MLLNFSDRTRTGVFNMIWPLAWVQENVKDLFQQQTYLPTRAVARSENPGGLVVMGGDNVPTPVEIG